MTPQPLPAPFDGRAATENRAQPLHRPEPRSGVGPVSHGVRRPARPTPPRHPLVSQLGPLGALATVPGNARMHVRLMLTTWGMAALVEVAELLISEMVTNAVEACTDDNGHPMYLNGRMPLVVVRLISTGRGVVFEVWDQAPELPVVKNAQGLEEHGRGMFLVETLSARWAWKTAASWPGKCVWAELVLELTGSGLPKRPPSPEDGPPKQIQAMTDPEILPRVRNGLKRL